MNRILIGLACLLSLFVACRKNMDITTQEILGPFPTVNEESSLTGRVVDNLGNPLSGATVEIAGLNLTTNEKGLFFVHKKLLNKNGTYVHVRQNGFFNAGKFAFPSLNTTAFIEIKMTPKALVTTFEAGSGAQFTANGGATVIIPAGAIAKSGQVYSGTVKVFSVWLDPTQAETYTLMPGDLRAQDVGGYAKVLATFGMLGVELETPSGEKLNLLDGKKAAITMTVPGDLLSDAPASIPTWHFDENNGYWKEEGSATLAGNRYEFEVAHFSYWNCDLPGAPVLLHGRVVSTNGPPVPEAYVEITKDGYQYNTAHGTANSNGVFGGVVPADAILTLIIKNYCGEVVHEQIIGPLTENTDLGNIQIESPNLVTITGILLDCNQHPIQDGLAYVESDGSIFGAIPTDASGHFSVVASNCLGTPDIIVTGYDLAALQQSPPIQFPIINDLVNVGNITVCTVLDEFLQITVGPYTKTLVNTTFQSEPVVGNIGDIEANDLDTVGAHLTFVSATGVLQSVSCYLRDPGSGAIQYFGCQFCPTCNCSDLDPGAINFTHYPSSVGEYATGTASGSVRTLSGVDVPYFINFRIKKE
ncbi:MAG TPA: hypothetical protein PLO67_15730 [Saprospiraceae bacterium]|nr:hypothetical protein [Saprospiraceae bacterium]HPI07796.1 hypothetical protein [Saprospiraceae bacterium]